MNLCFVSRSPAQLLTPDQCFFFFFLLSCSLTLICPVLINSAFCEGGGGTDLCILQILHVAMRGRLISFSSTCSAYLIEMLEPHANERFQSFTLHKLNDVTFFLPVAHLCSHGDASKRTRAELRILVIHSLPAPSLKKQRLVVWCRRCTERQKPPALPLCLCLGTTREDFYPDQRDSQSCMPF